MAVSDEFIDYVIDQLLAWGEVSARKMFGGAGLYCDGRMFGLIADDVAYLKVDDSNREDFVKAGAAPFNPYPDKVEPHGIGRGASIFGVTRRSTSAYAKAMADTRSRSSTGRTRGFLRRRVKTTVMSYYEIPADVLENPKVLTEWAQRSFDIAQKKKS
jgi:TfoX/Sxy family transcriptional regulator of competence genes